VSTVLFLSIIQVPVLPFPRGSRNNNISSIMFHSQQQQQQKQLQKQLQKVQRHSDDKGQDPSERVDGRRSESRSTISKSGHNMSSSILNELQNIESELHKTSIERRRTKANSIIGRNSKEDPPLRAEERYTAHAFYTDDNGDDDDDDYDDDNDHDDNDHDTENSNRKRNSYQQQRTKTTSTSTLTPTVRFSEQLEIYTKQKSQRLTPTIPILRATGRTTPTTTLTTASNIGCTGSILAQSPGMTLPSSISSTCGDGMGIGIGIGGLIESSLLLPLSSSSRDPTPRSAERISDDHNRYHQRREPVGKTTNLAFCASDPPLDRSNARHNLMMSSSSGFALKNNNNSIARLSSAAATRAADPLPLEKGALSLRAEINHGSSRNLPHHLLPKRVEKVTNEVELNPRRLASDFALTLQQQQQQQLQKQTSMLRKDLAPTPTNRYDDKIQQHKQLAPTPNMSNQRNKKMIDDERKTATPPPPPPPPPPSRRKDLVPSPTKSNVAQLFSPTIPPSSDPIASTSVEQHRTSQQSGLMPRRQDSKSPPTSSLPPTLPITLPLPPSHPHYKVVPQPMSAPTTIEGEDDVGPKAPYNVHEWKTSNSHGGNTTNSSINDSPSELSTESVSAYLINKYTKNTIAAKKAKQTKKQDNKNMHHRHYFPGGPLPKSEASTLFDDDNEEEEDDDIYEMVTSPLTPLQKVHTGICLQQRMAVSDSKLYEKVTTTNDKKDYTSTLLTISPWDKRKPLSYLQLDDEGDDDDKSSSFLQLNQTGTNVPVILPIVPKHIEVQMGSDLYSVDDSTEQGEDQGLTSSRRQEQQQQTTHRLGNALKRLRSPKIPFQNLNSGSDGISYDYSYEPSPTKDNDTANIHDNESSNTNSIVKQRTTDTMDSHSSDISRPVSNSTLSKGGSGSTKWGGHLFANQQDNDSTVTDTWGLLAVAARNKRRKNIGKTSMIWLLACTVITCLAAGLPIYFIMTNNSDKTTDPTTTESTTLSSSSSDNVMKSKAFNECVDYDDGREWSFSDRYSTIRQYLRVLSFSSTSDMDSPRSAQRKALCWISEFDGYKIDISQKNTDAIVQRYSLAVLYYSWIKEDSPFENDEEASNSFSSDSSSTHGLNTTDFLSSTHECDWDILMCDVSGTSVIGLLLSDKNLHGSLPVEIGNLVDLGEYISLLNQPVVPVEL
jgi:hypothetical protein